MRQIDKNSEEGNQKLGMRMKRDREKRERGLKKEIIFFIHVFFPLTTFPFCIIIRTFKSKLFKYPP